ncbi:hypothetical protein IWQ60_009127 [Tieghemiomyces parasiticus]|uniref:BRISC and BRCA1-A complex member 2 n=1 Tax=Tieghemiomyces parasiticus TaxID=78921 RepID=A0A9W7ZU58_9FUNG|nr:hypothetical protein IWQ60_009127 [Tieghemiomyces parasiticus]
MLGPRTTPIESLLEKLPADIAVQFRPFVASPEASFTDNLRSMHIQDTPTNSGQRTGVDNAAPVSGPSTNIPGRPRLVRTWASVATPPSKVQVSTEPSTSPPVALHDRMVIQLNFCRSQVEVMFAFDLAYPDFPPDVILSPSSFKPPLHPDHPFNPAWAEVVKGVDVYRPQNTAWVAQVLMRIASLYKYGCWKDDSAFEGRVIYGDRWNPVEVLLRIPLYLTDPLAPGAGKARSPAGTLWVTYEIPPDIPKASDVQDVSATCALKKPWLEWTAQAKIPDLVKTRSLADYVGTLVKVLETQIVETTKSKYDGSAFVQELARRYKAQTIEYDRRTSRRISFMFEMSLADGAGPAAPSPSILVPVVVALVHCEVPPQFPHEPMEIQVLSPIQFMDRNDHLLYGPATQAWRPHAPETTLTDGVHQWG